MKIFYILYIALCGIVGAFSSEVGYGLDSGVFWFYFFSVVASYVLGNLNEKFNNEKHKLPNKNY